MLAATPLPGFSHGRGFGVLSPLKRPALGRAEPAEQGGPRQSRPWVTNLCSGPTRVNTMAVRAIGRHSRCG